MATTARLSYSQFLSRWRRAKNSTSLSGDVTEDIHSGVGWDGDTCRWKKIPCSILWKYSGRKFSWISDVAVTLQLQSSPTDTQDGCERLRRSSQPQRWTSRLVALLITWRLGKEMPHLPRIKWSSFLSDRLPTLAALMSWIMFMMIHGEMPGDNTIYNKIQINVKIL